MQSKNDLFNVLLKMSRHTCVVSNRIFMKIFADLQRPESLGTDARELGEVMYIREKGEPTLTFPVSDIIYRLRENGNIDFRRSAYEVLLLSPVYLLRARL